MTVSQVVMVPCFFLVLLSRPIFFFSYFCRCESALAINIVMTSGEVVSKEGHGGGQAMVTSKLMVVYGQAWLVVGGDVGSELKDRLNGRACRSDSRWRSGSTSSFDEGSRCPAVERRGARVVVVATPSQIELWAPILLMCLHWKMWSPKGSMRRPHGQKGLSVGSKSGRQSLHLQAGINIQGGSRCDGWLRQREMRG